MQCIKKFVPSEFTAMRSMMRLSASLAAAVESLEDVTGVLLTNPNVDLNLAGPDCPHAARNCSAPEDSRSDPVQLADQVKSFCRAALHRDIPTRRPFVSEYATL